MAYDSVLHERRKALHERTAQAIEAALLTLSLDEHYSELAHHYSRSGNTEKADRVPAPGGATGGATLGQCGSDHPSDHRLRALTTLPDTRERAQQELMLHLCLGMPLQATRGSSSPEVRATYTRARELCQQVGETRQLFPVLFGLWTFHQVRGEFLAARELGEQLLGLAQREQDPALLIERHMGHWAAPSSIWVSSARPRRTWSRA